MAEIVKLEGIEHVVGFAIPSPRDAVLYFIGTLDEKDAPPVGERFATKEMLHRMRFGKDMEQDPTMRNKQMQAWGYCLHCVEEWCIEHQCTYVSFPLENRATGKSEHYYGITENSTVIALAKRYIATRKAQYALAFDSKLTLLQKTDEARKLRHDQDNNLREILRIIKANEKADKKKS